MSQVERICGELEGLVQGVGFRPFVARLARELGLSGWVANTCQGVTLELQGPTKQLAQFSRRLREDAPASAQFSLSPWRSLEPRYGDERGFFIKSSHAEGPASAIIPPDLAPCEACKEELFDPEDRRYLYPFLNCTGCGPRHSIISGLPYDRSSTSMAGFALCEACHREYQDPDDRRYHAQPIACPDCGPRLRLLGGGQLERLLSTGRDALMAAVEALGSGQILGLKGVGGFQLLADLQDIERLRHVKRRPRKPFALMFPGLEDLHRWCQPDAEEAAALCDPAAPIVLLQAQDLPQGLAPGLGTLGAMLPSSALHLLLLRCWGRPLVVTSANISGAPLPFDDLSACVQLAPLCDLLLTHDRPILQPLDDSVAQVLDGRLQILRRGRGFASLPIPLHRSLEPSLAVGGDLKSASAWGRGKQAWLGPYIGDLEHPEALRRWHRQLDEHLAQAPPLRCDLHPEYHSTHEALELGLPVEQVQHHHAHLFAAMLEHQLSPPVLGVIWDGTGYGTDGSIWGGECFLFTPQELRRVACLRPFSLPGGERALGQPLRIALALLYELWGDPLFAQLPELFDCPDGEARLLQQMLARSLQCPRTSSMGRLFDGVSSLLGLCDQVSYEGEAAMVLEASCAASPLPRGYAMPLRVAPERALRLWDWGPMVLDIAEDLRLGIPTASIAMAFHQALADAILQAARAWASPKIPVLLSGGCFQNRLLLEASARTLRDHGFPCFWPERVPANDGGLALGQLAGANGRLWTKELR